MKRGAAVQQLAELIDSVALSHPARVAVDGVDGAGKTHLAQELAAVLRSMGRTFIGASIDGFHRPSGDRHRRGQASSDGYYLDSFDLDAVRSTLLEPLGPGGSLRYRRAIFDHRLDRPVEAPEELAPADAILLFDGIFLHRPELVDHWDLSIFGCRHRDGRSASTGA